MLHNHLQSAFTTSAQKASLHLINSRPASREASDPGFLLIISRRCSSFFAEAAVLVLVFGILDYFMQKGHIELAWIIGALGISALLLAASIAMDCNAQRWIKAHP